jgi:ATP-binding cassette subfamily B protein
MARRRSSEDPDDKDLPRAPINRQTLADAWRLAGYLWPYRSLFVAAMLLLGINSLLGLAFPYLAGSIVDETLGRPTAAGSLWGQSGISSAVLMLAAAVVLQAATGFLESYWLASVSERSLADLRRDTYARLIRLPMAFHNRRRVGELSSRIASDLTQLQDTLNHAVPHFLSQLVIWSAAPS